MSKLNIFDLTVQQTQVQKVIEENIDVFTDEQLAEALAMQELSKEQFEKKVLGYAYMIKKFGAMAETAKNEIDRISKIKKTYENCATRMKLIVAESMEKTGNEKIDSETMKLYLMKKADKLEVLDFAKVPKKFKTKLDPVLNKTALSLEFKNAEKVPEWLKKTKQGKSLVIK